MYKNLIIILLITIGNWSFASINDNRNIILHPPKNIEQKVFYGLKDEKYILDDFRGQFVIAHFWATWCPSCFEEIQELDALQKDLYFNGVKVVAISEDFKGASFVEEYFHKNNIVNLDIFIDKKNGLMREYNIAGLPSTMLINPEGKVFARISAPIKWRTKEISEFILKQAEGAKIPAINSK